MNVLRILCIYLRLYHYFCCFWTKLSTAWWLAVDIAAYPPFLCCRIPFVLKEISRASGDDSHRDYNPTDMIYKG